MHVLGALGVVGVVCLAILPAGFSQEVCSLTDPGCASCEDWVCEFGYEPDAGAGNCIIESTDDFSFGFDGDDDASTFGDQCSDMKCCIVTSEEECLRYTCPQGVMNVDTPCTVAPNATPSSDSSLCGDAVCCEPECTEDEDCLPDEICCPTRQVCELPLVDDPSACGDPHMTGFRGQKFDFTGEDGAWYALVADSPSLHLNMRVTVPVSNLPEITYITGLALLTTDADGVEHRMVITVKKPHSLATACPEGMFPCLADGSLRVALDGKEVLLGPGTVMLTPDIGVSAVNLPGECRSFGFEKYWEKKKRENAQTVRRLTNSLLDMGEWILGDPTATNMEECTQYVNRAYETGGEGGSELFDHQSEHASFQIMTPRATIRLSHGKLHQLPMRDPTDHFDLPDHLTWQMNVAIDQTDVSPTAKGILGETFVPTRDINGVPITRGIESIRGAQEDYRVVGPLGVVFAQG